MRTSPLSSAKRWRMGLVAKFDTADRPVAHMEADEAVEAFRIASTRNSLVTEATQRSVRLKAFYRACRFRGEAKLAR